VAEEEDALPCFAMAGEEKMCERSQITMKKRFSTLPLKFNGWVINNLKTATYSTPAPCAHINKTPFLKTLVVRRFFN
jgi:hypothetical protein